MRDLTPDTESIELFDVVEVVATERTRALQISGRTGTVVGVSEAETAGDNAAYAVSVDGLDRTVMFVVSELRATGERKAREDIYDGTSIRVTDRGEIHPPD